MKPLHYLFLAISFTICQPTWAADANQESKAKRARVAAAKSKKVTEPTPAPPTPVVVAAITTEEQPLPSAPLVAIPSLLSFLQAHKLKIVDGLPSIKTVYPTGEKPLVVINLKCPAEVLVGETFAIPNAMRNGVNMALEGISSTNLLSFNMQLVCS